MTIHGYQDWHRVVQHAGAPLVHAQQVTNVAFVSFGSFFCGDATHLYLFAQSNTQGILLRLQFFVDSALTIPVTSYFWESDTLQHPIDDYVPVVGDWVSIDATSTGAAFPDTLEVTVVPLIVTTPIRSSNGEASMITNRHTVVGAGLNTIIPALWVAGGPAWLSVTTDAAVWQVFLDAYNAAATLFDRIAAGTNASDPGGIVQRQILLPRKLTHLFIGNGDGVARTFNCVLVVQT